MAASGNILTRIIISAVDQASGTLRNISDAAKQAGAAIVAALSLDKFIELNSQLESTKRALEQILGSEQAAADALAHLTDIADRNGQQTAVLADQYVSFAAAAKGTALEGQATTDIFDAVASAMGTLGRSSVQTERAFVALGQMMSKGQIYAEEWRGQLSEALPAANAAVQKATGLTTAQFREMMEAGQLLAVDVLPALAKGLTDLGLVGTDKVDTLGAAVTRLSDAFNRAFTETGQGGLAEPIAKLTAGLATAIDTAVASVVSLGKNIGATQAFIDGAIPSWKEYLGALWDNTKAAAAYIAKINDVGKASGSTTVFMQQLSSASLQSAKAYAEQEKSADKTLATAKKQADATDQAARAIVSLAEISGDAREKLDAEATATGLNADAAERLSAAQQAVLDVTTNRIATIQQQIESIEQAKTAEGAETTQLDALINARKDQITKLQQTQKEQQATADKTAELAEKTRLEAVQAKLAAETYGDQSTKLGALQKALKAARFESQSIATAQKEAAEAAKRLESAQSALNIISAEYKAKMDEAVTGNRDVSASLDDLGQRQREAQALVDGLTAKIKAGKEADSQAKDAKERLAIAQAKVKDALQDTAEKLHLSLTGYESESRHLADINGLRAEHLHNLADEARARGDLETAQQLDAQAQQLEISALEQQIAIKQQALVVEQQYLQVLIQRLQLQGQLTPQDQEQIQGIRDHIQVQQDEISGMQESVRHKKADADATRQVSDETENANVRQERFAKAARGAAAAAQWMASMLAEAKQSIAQYSQEASVALDAVTKGVHSLQENIRNIEALQGADFVNTDSLSKAKGELANLTAALESTRAKVRDLEDATHRPFNLFAGMDKELSAVYEFQAEVLRAKIAAEQMAIASEELKGKLSDLGDAFDAGNLGASDYLAQLERLRSQYARLGDEALSDLDSKIRDLTDQMRDFTDSSRSGLLDLQKEWAALNDQKLDEFDLEQQTQRLEIETQLLQAKKDKNAEAIAYLQQQLVLLDKIYAKRKADEAATEAADKIKAAEDAAAEAARRAALTDEARQYEDTLADLQQQLTNAILANDKALQDSILAQIEAEKKRHATYLANLDAEKRARESADTSTTTSSTTSTSTTTTDTTSTRVSTPPATGRTLTLSVDDGKILRVIGSDAGVNAFIDALERAGMSVT